MPGLAPARHVIVEIATIVTDDQLQIVAEGPDLVVHQPPEAMAEMEEVVRTMHTTSKLLTAIETSTVSLEEAGRATLEFIKAHVPEPARVPLSGNSIAPNRPFLPRSLPEIKDPLHYGPLPVSPIKDLTPPCNPAALKPVPRKATAPQPLATTRGSVAKPRGSPE